MSNIPATPYDLRVERLIEPIGLDVQSPRFSWKLPAEAPAQAAYRIVVESDTGTTWDSGRVESAQQLNVPYGGDALRPTQRYAWEVTVWGTDGSSVTSDQSSWETGLFGAEKWTDAQWITLPRVPFERLDYRPSPQLRRTFDLAAAPIRARVYVTALGLYRLSLNGERVGRDEFTPGWTDYEQRVQYQAYDVTSLLRAGNNALGVVLGDGWHSGCTPYSTKVRNRLAVAPQARLRLVVDLADGTSVEVVSDGSWTGRHGPILASDRYRGEIYDARLEAPGWDTPDFDDGNWGPVEIGPGTSAPLVGMRAEPSRVTGELKPIEVTQPLLPGQAFLFDFGQNVVGWTRIRVDGPGGMEITLRHGEMLSPDGSLYTTNLWDTTMQTDTFITKGGPEEWEPTFTMHGFRYVEVLGFPGIPTLEDLTAVVVHSDMRKSGEFTCSNEMVNQLVRNIDWCQRGNFVEVPTDCPQRAERLGWMGDAELFAPTGAYLYDVGPLFGRWLQDIKGAQSAEGAFPNVVPGEHVAALPAIGAPGWGDAGVILPWLVYEVYGDERLLAEHYDSMTAWVDYVHKQTEGLVYDPPHAWGDWLAVPPDQYEATTKDVLGTLYFAHSTSLVARAATVLGREDDERRYRQLFDDTAAAFRSRFVDADGRVSGGTQTVHALAIRFGLLDGGGPEAVEAAARHLVADIEARDGHLSTGIVGTAHLLPTLTDTGHLEVAYSLLENETYPSWGYSIRNGATTIWERWDGWTEENGFQTPAMNSFNHYAIGSVGYWLFSTVAGIAPLEPGYRAVRIAPKPGGSLTWAEATYESAHGPIRCRWDREGSKVTVDVSTPPGIRTVVELPDGTVHETSGGTERFATTMA